MTSEEPKLQFWYDFASPYSFLAAMRIDDLATASGVEVQYRPLFLWGVFKARGWERPPATFAARVDYMWRDVARHAARAGHPFQRPSTFPRNSVLSDRLACVALREGWVAPLTRAVFEAAFVENADIADPKVLAHVVEGLGGDGHAAVAQAQAGPAKQHLQDLTDEALSLGVFGAPSFVAEGELFWGDDRLGEALDWSLEHRVGESREAAR